MSGMRILIVSDTHRRDGNFRRVLEKTGPIDMLIHLGDTEGSESYFREWVDNDVCVIHVVRETTISFPSVTGKRRSPSGDTGRS